MTVAEPHIATEQVSHRLVRVEHERCSELDYDAKTYVLAPAEWTEDEIDARVDAAHREYLAHFAKASKLPATAPKRPDYRPNFDACDQGLSVAEVKARWEQEKATFAAWEAEQRPLRYPFERYLVEQGFVEIWEDETYRVTVDWGHAHGSTYEYGTTDLGKDVPPPLSLIRGGKSADADG